MVFPSGEDGLTSQGGGYFSRGRRDLSHEFANWTASLTAEVLDSTRNQGNATTDVCHRKCTIESTRRATKGVQQRKCAKKALHGTCNLCSVSKEVPATESKTGRALQRAQQYSDSTPGIIPHRNLDYNVGQSKCNPASTPQQVDLQNCAHILLAAQSGLPTEPRSGPPPKA